MLRRLRKRLYRNWERFEVFVEGVIYDRDHSPPARVLGFFLKGFSYLFSGLVRLRLKLYRNRVIFKDRPLGCLVVVVGNLTVGGTGKTPVVERFAQALMAKGRKVAILSRGYKSRREPPLRRFWRWLTYTEAPPPKVVSDGEKVLLDSTVAGDEPYMLARNLPGVVVLVDKDRVKAGAYAIRKFGVDTLVLDDGFQYLALKGRLNLLLVDQTNPFGNGHLLPRGILREPISHLSRASYIFLTKSKTDPDGELLDLINKHNPKAQIIRCTHHPKHFLEVNGDRLQDVDFLKETPVGVFSAIASPRGFEEMIDQLVGDLRYRRRFLDHHRYTRGELDRVLKRARHAGSEVVVTTEKDAVRIPPDYKPVIPLYFIRMEIEILEGFKDFEAAVGEICFPQGLLSVSHAD